ncbi:peptide antibiotic resistance protein [Rhizobium sp. SEMIA 4085]|uniref:Transcriptional regulator SARP family/tetratricopeptide repeat domain-containing protein n=1 Tax=Rhizobium gallicum bv. gallicum R602sp TaxID=1041138 RepID=A0A0B4XGT7_9HYPH|nr:peptide antibiotic resistance protein [Rhizobium gallicum]AJD45940.1 transcriptional regulator SARP family/tetratricopeptide repeat domain-containing protein [Rhizobium gallicum bv. gallicum R602sp]NNH30943.1 peptide antibiotic resistance protein [Rhizobium sp. SEMIA 4085]
MLYLQTFGDLRLTDANGNAIRYPAKGLVMVAYLFSRKTHELSRHELSEFLWADAEAELSGLNLRKLISRIRQIDDDTNEALLQITSGTIRLRTEALAVDLQALDSAMPPLARLRAISDLHQRDFMASVKPSTRSIDNWITGERRNHRLKLREVLFDALPHAQSNDDLRAISTAGLYLLEKDPGDEEIREMLRRLSGTNLADGDRREKASRPKISALPSSPQDALVRIEPGKPSSSVLPRVVLLPPIPQGHVAGLVIANALIEDVTIELCALRNISIVAPHTAEQIRRDSDKAQVVARHSISYLLETRLSTEGLYAQLIYFPTDEVIWATRFTMTSDALPTQRRLIAQRLTFSLVQELAKNERARLNIEADPQAYHSYLVGASLMGKLTLPHIRKARHAFKEALRYNPDFSPAFAGLARTYTSEWLVTAQGNEELLRLAETNAGKAIEGDSIFAGGHRELGVAKLYLGDVDHSVSALSLAEELSPHFADVIYSHADTLVHASRPGDALSKIKKAISLNPISPDAYLWCAAGACYFLEQYQDAIDYVEAMKDKAPAHRIAAASCAMIGDRRRAQFYRQRAEALNPVFDVEKWLSVVPFKEQWQKDLYREGLLKAGF